MTIQPVFDMEEDEDSEEISEHGKRENGKLIPIIVFVCL